MSRYYKFNIKKMKTIISKTLIICLTIFACSCSKDNYNTPTDSKFESIYEKEQELGLANFEEGQKHNELLDIIVSNWSIKETTDNQSIINEIDRILKENTEEFADVNGFEYEEFSTLTEYNKELLEVVEKLPNQRYLVQLGFSYQLAQKVNEFYNAFINLDGVQNVEKVQAKMLSFYNRNATDLSREDQRHFGAFIDVAMSSLEFWYPRSNGGLGKLANFRKTPSIAKAWPGWGRVILADAIGTLSVAVTSVIQSGGTSALPNPALGGLPTASALGLVGGATASAYKAN